MVPGSQDAASDGWSQNGKTEFDETIQRQVRGAWIYKTNQQKDNDSDQCILETFEMTKTKTMANTNKFQEHSKERSQILLIHLIRVMRRHDLTKNTYPPTNLPHLENTLKE